MTTQSASKNPLVVQREQLPDTPLLTAAQAINWIAFGRAADGDLSGHHDIQRMWLFAPEGDGTTSTMLVALEMLASGTEEWPEDAPLPSPGWRRLGNILLRAKQLCDEWHQSPTDMALALKMKLLRYRIRMDRTREASGELLDKLIRGKLHCFAVPEMGEGRQHVGAQTVPREFFYTSGVSIWLSGEITIPGGLGFHDAKFHSEEIASLWPSGSKGADQSRPRQYSSASLRRFYRDRVAQWPADKPGPTEVEDWAACNDEFDTELPRQAIRDVRKEFARLEWMKRGPRG